MQTYELTLQSEVSKSFRCQKAANSLDIDVEKKSIHHFKVEADIDSPFEIGLILGASGSGKTTLARSIYGEDCFKTFLDLSKPVIEQFPEVLSYDECAEILSGVGLTSVPCWIRPAYTLSNGQRSRAEAALAIYLNPSPVVVIDEWTSVVDRTVAKVMSHCIQKFARRNSKKVVLLSCHYDVSEWLNPDWVIDCNQQTFQDRRSLRPDERKRTEQLEFTIREITKESWPYFSKYHYLSEKLPGGYVVYYGLFQGENQIGFQCFANYTPWTDKKKPRIMHSNRTVIHPDYAGLGLGIRLINQTSKIMKAKGNKVMAAFSSVPIFKAMSKQIDWKLVNISRPMVKNKGHTIQNGSMRTQVKMYSFEYVGE